MLSFLDNPTQFRIDNRRAWKTGWDYWYRKEYVHQGIKEYLSGKLDEIKTEQERLNILDLGCGSAWCGKYFEKAYHEYFGIDFNENLIQKLKLDFWEKSNCKFDCYDIESDEEIGLQKGTFNFILGSFIVLELSDLKKFFFKIASLQAPGQYLLLTGLDPLNEIIRDSHSLEEINSNIFKYRHSKRPVVLEKSMSFNGEETDLRYYRILYSINDILSEAKLAGYEICEVNDMLNKDADSPIAPIYYAIKLKLNAESENSKSRILR